MAQVTEKITYTATPEQVERMHTAFDEALVEARTMLGRTYPMIINGKERTAPQTFAATSPIDRSLVLGHFHLRPPQDVDDAVIHGLSLRMPLLGHIKKADFTGLDLVQRALANKTWEPAPITGRSKTVDKLMAEGRSGVMVGKGFFDYAGRSPDDLFRERDRRLLSLKRHLRELGDI